MADDGGGLSGEELEALNLFLNEKVGEEGLLCPLTGEATALSEWNAPAGVVVLPGRDDGADYEALPLTSPAGGVVLISAARFAAWRKKDKAADEEPPPSR